MTKYKLSHLKDFKNIKKIFFVGVKGVGMSPLAIIAKESGLEVEGSDINEIFITDKYLSSAKIKVHTSFDASIVASFFNGTKKDECLIITTGAHKGFDNSQSRWAKENGFDVITQGQALSVFMEGEIFGRNFDGIAIAGSHGKTTITALLATTMSEMSLDPTYTIGTGEIFPLGAPGYFGTSDYFIAEADEYASEPVYDRVPKFLYLNPSFAIFNNIDFDHPDLFSDISQIEDAFLQFSHNVKSGGKLFVNGDDKRLRNLSEKVNKDIKIITFGFGENNNYIAKKIVENDSISRFTVERFGTELGVFELNLLGTHNCQNALAVISLLTELGFEYNKIRVALRVFKGSKRRMEVLGKSYGGAILIDDYAHHPLEILTTLDAFKKKYPERKIIAIFQPHTYSRTKALLSGFAKSFGIADNLLLLPIFKSQRDTENDVISEEDYFEAFKKYSEPKLLESFESVIEYCKKNFDSEKYLIVTIGAGDVYKINQQLLSL